MRISETVTLPGHPDQVRDLLLNVDFQQEKCRRSGAVDVQTAFEPQGPQDADPEDDAETGGDAPVLVVRRTMPAADLPDIARSLVGETLDVVETYTWDPLERDAGASGHGASLGITVEGTPVRFVGSVLLEQVPSDDGATHTRQRVEGELTAHIPLIGGRIEKAAAPALLAGLRVEESLSREWLGR